MTSGAAIKRMHRAVLTIPLLCDALLGQSVPPITHPKTVHVQGKIRTSSGSPIAGKEVKFEGENNATVSSDRRGFYRADLPTGLYTMTVAPRQYMRPLFRIATSGTIVLNITLHPAAPNCDPLFPIITHADGTTETRGSTADDYKDACGGWDYLPVPSGDGVPFELFVRYSRRQRFDDENDYSSYYRDGPVFVAYNLFSLYANSVTYDPKSRILKASGDVVIDTASGTVRHADTAIFRIENGQATQ